MILDSLSNAYLYESIHPSFKRVFDFIRATDFSKLDDGRIELDGNALFLNLASSHGKELAPLEAHRNYIDIQMPLSCIEKIGFKAVSDCREITKPYNDEKDILFFGDALETVLTIHPGQFAIFFPQDGHAPSMANDYLRKVVVKIKI